MHGPPSLTQSVHDIRFIPEIVVVAPDPSTGLLIRHFTVYYGIGGGEGEGGEGRGGGGRGLVDGPIGNVSVQDPIETMNVSAL